MSTYRYAVKVRRLRHGRASWSCPPEACGFTSMIMSRRTAYLAADLHASLCEPLHRANWAAACPSCRRYGTIAPACTVCLGCGVVRDREGLT